MKWKIAENCQKSFRTYKWFDSSHKLFVFGAAIGLMFDNHKDWLNGFDKNLCGWRDCKAVQCTVANAWPWAVLRKLEFALFSHNFVFSLN